MKRIRTKAAKKILSKKEQAHLSEMGINSVESLKRTREEQIRQRETSPIEPCFECKAIARKLGLQ